MEPDDQNFTSNRSKIKRDIDNNIIDDYKADLEEVDQCVDAVDGNGNRLDGKNFECNCMRNSCDNQLDEKIIRKLHAMSISEDDYGEWGFNRIKNFLILFLN